MLKKIKLENSIYIVFAVYILSLLLPEVSIILLEPKINFAVKIIRYICYVFFVIKIIIDWKKDNTKITLSVLFLALLSVLVFAFSKNQDLIILSISLCAIRNINKEKLIKIAFYVYITIFFGVIILSLIGLIPDWTYTRMGNKDNLRHSLGFSYPTLTFGLYLMILLMYILQRKNKIKLLEIIILEIINIFLYKYTLGRTSFILITMILIGITLNKIKFINNFFKNINTQKIIKICSRILPTLSLIVMIVGTILYGMNNKFAVDINQKLSGRLELNSEAFENYKLTPLGQKIKWYGLGGVGYVEDRDFKYNYVDNSYARIILNFGVITMITTILAYTILLEKLTNEKNYYLVFCIFIILILAEIEPSLIDLSKNIFVIYLSELLNYGTIEALSSKNIKNFISTKK